MHGVRGRREDGRDTRRREGQGERGPWASLRVAGTDGHGQRKVANPWGAPEDLVLEVRLEDGRTRLFWHHELEAVAEGALAGGTAHGTVGALPS